MPTLFRKKDGKYRVQWRENGRRFSRTFVTQKEAKLFELKIEAGEIDLKEISSPTFREYSEIWLKEYCHVEKAESQWKEDRSTISLHLLPALADTRLVDLCKADLVRLKSDLSRKTTSSGKSLSPKTVNNILALAKKMLNTAVDMDLVSANPWVSVRPLKAQENDFNFWTPDERDQFIRHVQLINEPFARLVCFACHTGLRLGELAGLQRSDVDYQLKLVYVRSQYNLKLGKRIAGTKGGRSETVPLNAAALAAISHAIGFSTKESIFDLSMFHNARRTLKRYAGRAGVKEIRFHDLRHTFASTLAMAGVDLMVIQKLMRHRSYQMTLRYAHLHPDHLKGATDVLLHPDCTQESYPHLPSSQTLDKWWAHRDLNPGPAGYEDEVA